MNTAPTQVHDVTAPPPSLLWAPLARIDGRWARNVCLEITPNGHWGRIDTDIATPPENACMVDGPLLPGLVNAHSHAFQRAFAGLAERRSTDADDFWSWRDRMYGVALRISAEQMRAVAAQLYVELLKGGYTQVCEFHYLHHTETGHPYADPATMAWAVADAAQDASMGLTLLPVLYERAGFAQPRLRDDQRRFASTPAFITELQRSATTCRRPLLNAGVSIHSLRAASAASIQALLARLDGQDMPIHIHVSEQMQEVRDCLQTYGQRPMQWLAQQGWLDRRWQLVHATHADAAEINTVAHSGAAVVICPSTEGNLGDGLADISGWLQAGVPMAIGSDSHVCRQSNEELRWLEYGQRLALQRRNVTAQPGQQNASAARLWDAAQSAGAAAAGQPQWGLVTGARADALVLDRSVPGLLGVPSSHLLDAWVFACDTPAISDVWVAGKPVVKQGRHVHEATIAARFAQTMDALWSEMRDD